METLVEPAPAPPATRLRRWRLAFLIGGGGLGITIQTGLKLNQDEILIVGAWLVALVALTFDWLGAVAERLLKPRGL